MMRSRHIRLALTPIALALLSATACTFVAGTTLRPPSVDATASVPVPPTVATGVPSAARAAASSYTRGLGSPLTGGTFVSEVNLEALPPDQLSLVRSACRSAGYTLRVTDIARLKMFSFPVRVPPGIEGGVRYVNVLVHGSRVVGVFGSQPDMAPDVFGFGSPS